MANISVLGELGAFGGGMGLRVLYVQCALPVRDIGKIKLAEELPGSEEWPVRDLFQRDVDYDRVEKGIVPWLDDGDKVKFFAPITLALLPFDSSTTRLEAEIPVLSPTSKGGEDGVSVGGMFQLSAEGLPESFSGRATLKWDDKRCHLVALDGQHRVAALRAVRERGGASSAAIADWSIPAVIMCVVRESKAGRTHRVSYLDVARSVFVYINTQARTPSRARQILLNDESPAAIIAQEFVQYSHEADIDDIGHFPMSALRWRDGSEASIGEKHKLLQLAEVYDLIEDLMLGDRRGGHRAASARLLAPLDLDGGRLQELLVAPALNADEAHELRELAREHFVPAFSALVVGLTPFREHAQRVRVIEKRLLDDGERGSAALHAIRIGGAGNWRNRTDVAQLVVKSVADMERSVRSIPELLRHDIGLRGVVSGFMQVLPLLRESDGDDAELHSLVNRYFKGLNGRLAEGWMVGVNERMVRHLRHVTRKETGAVANYRLDDVPDALGALCAAIASTAICPRNSAKFKAFLKDCLRKRLFETVRQGYVGELKRQYKDQNPGWSAGEIKDKAQEKSRPMAARHIDRILEDLGYEVTDV
jgi:hypothetical protein